MLDNLIPAAMPKEEKRPANDGYRRPNAGASDSYRIVT
jgi:hypothetical protein